MSVGKLHTVRIVPIARQPDMPAQNPSIIARWLGADSIQCDGTGGIATLSLNMGGVGEIYGSHAMWDLQICTVEMDSAPLTAYAITIQVMSFELDGSTSMQYSWFPGLNTGTYYEGAQSHVTSLIKHRSSDAPGFPSCIRMLAPNTFGQKWYLYAAGYVYDERMI